MAADSSMMDSLLFEVENLQRQAEDLTDSQTKARAYIETELYLDSMPDLTTKLQAIIATMNGYFSSVAAEAAAGIQPAAGNPDIAAAVATGLAAVLNADLAPAVAAALASKAQALRTRLDGIAITNNQDDLIALHVLTADVSDAPANVQQSLPGGNSAALLQDIAAKRNLVEAEIAAAVAAMPADRQAQDLQNRLAAIQSAPHQTEDISKSALIALNILTADVNRASATVQALLPGSNSEQLLKNIDAKRILVETEIARKKNDLKSAFIESLVVDYYGYLLQNIHSQLRDTLSAIPRVNSLQVLESLTQLKISAAVTALGVAERNTQTCLAQMQAEEREKEQKIAAGEQTQAKLSPDLIAYNNEATKNAGQILIEIDARINAILTALAQELVNNLVRIPITNDVAERDALTQLQQRVNTADDNVKSKLSGGNTTELLTRIAQRLDPLVLALNLQNKLSTIAKSGDQTEVDALRRLQDEILAADPRVKARFPAGSSDQFESDIDIRLTTLASKLRRADLLTAAVALQARLTSIRITLDPVELAALQELLDDILRVNPDVMALIPGGEAQFRAEIEARRVAVTDAVAAAQAAAAAAVLAAQQQAQAQTLQDRLAAIRATADNQVKVDDFDALSTEVNNPAVTPAAVQDLLNDGAGHLGLDAFNAAINALRDPLVAALAAAQAAAVAAAQAAAAAAVLAAQQQAQAQTLQDRLAAIRATADNQVKVDDFDALSTEVNNPAVTPAAVQDLLNDGAGHLGLDAFNAAINALRDPLVAALAAAQAAAVAAAQAAAAAAVLAAQQQAQAQTLQDRLAAIRATADNQAKVDAFNALRNEVNNLAVTPAAVQALLNDGAGHLGLAAFNAAIYALRDPIVRAEQARQAAALLAQQQAAALLAQQQAAALLAQQQAAALLAQQQQAQAQTLQDRLAAIRATADNQAKVDAFDALRTEVNNLAVTPAAVQALLNDGAGNLGLAAFNAAIDALRDPIVAALAAAAAAKKQREHWLANRY